VPRSPSASPDLYPSNAVQLEQNGAIASACCEWFERKEEKSEGDVGQERWTEWTEALLLFTAGRGACAMTMGMLLSTGGNGACV
jgi:hypothetical protein